MSPRVTVTVHNAGSHTVWGCLAAKLGREPSQAEATAEVRRILTDGLVERASAGRLPHQRKGRDS